MSTALTFWFIRHKPTGLVIHYGTGENKTGGSWVEPATATNRIKLFTSEVYARAWLTRWLRGPERVHRTRLKEVRSHVRVSHRKRAEMEIVKLEVTLP